MTTVPAHTHSDPKAINLNQASWLSQHLMERHLLGSHGTMPKGDWLELAMAHRARHPEVDWSCGEHRPAGER